MTDEELAHIASRLIDGDGSDLIDPVVLIVRHGDELRYNVLERITLCSLIADGAPHRERILNTDPTQGRVVWCVFHHVGLGDARMLAYTK
jgi:hypothetical protein